MTLPRGRIEIHVVPSLQKERYPVTAFLAGTTLKGLGHTVQAAIEDLFTEAKVGKACQRLEREIAEVWTPVPLEPEP